MTEKEIIELGEKYLEARLEHQGNFGMKDRHIYRDKYRKIALELAPFLDKPLHLKGNVLVASGGKPQYIQMYTEESYKKLMDYRTQFFNG